MTQAQLLSITDKFNFDEIQPLLEKYGINTPFKEAMFLAQCAHESGEFKRLVEGSKYTKVETAIKLFANKKRSAESVKAAWEKGGPALLSFVYSNRMGNGAPETGDGYKYRGRGYIQLTGKSNYEGFANKIGKSLDEAVEYAATPTGGLESALYFWDREGLNDLCNEADVDGSIKAVTKKINGGYNGLADREAKFKKYFALLS